LPSKVTFPLIVIRPLESPQPVRHKLTNNKIKKYFKFFIIIFSMLSFIVKFCNNSILFSP
jgi:hypothetical protein